MEEYYLKSMTDRTIVIPTSISQYDSREIIVKGKGNTVKVDPMVFYGDIVNQLVENGYIQRQSNAEEKLVTVDHGNKSVVFNPYSEGNVDIIEHKKVASSQNEDSGIPMDLLKEVTNEVAEKLKTNIQYIESAKFSEIISDSFSCIDYKKMHDSNRGDYVAAIVYRSLFIIFDNIMVDCDKNEDKYEEDSGVYYMLAKKYQHLAEAFIISLESDGTEYKKNSWGLKCMTVEENEENEENEEKGVSQKHSNNVSSLDTESDGEEIIDSGIYEYFSKE